jgi:hypothetical protein
MPGNARSWIVSIIHEESRGRMPLSGVKQIGRVGGVQEAKFLRGRRQFATVSRVVRAGRLREESAYQPVGRRRGDKPS